MITISLCEKCSEVPRTKVGLQQLWYCSHEGVVYLKNFDTGNWSCMNATEEEAKNMAESMVRYENARSKLPQIPKNTH